MQREIKVGLTVMAGIVLLYLVVAWVNRSSLFAPPEKQYFIHFEQVNGLLEGDPVVVRGYQAGRVVDIRPAADVVRVEIALDEKIRLLEDAFGEIQIKELMGGKQVSLFPGREGNVVPEGADLRGQTSLDFSTAFSRFGGVMDQMDPENIDRFSRRLDSLGQELSQSINPAMLGRILINLERITTRLDRQTAALPLQRWVDTADTTLGEVRGLMARTDRLLLRLDTLTGQLDPHMISRADTLLGTAEESLSQINTLLSQASDLMQELENPHTFAGRALRDPGFAARIDSVLINLNQTLKQINEEKIIVGFRRK